MRFETKSGILVVEKNEDKELTSIMVVTENEDDKNLFTCKIVSGNDQYKEWDIVVVGRYSLFKLNYSWETVYFVEDEDILAKVSN